MDRDVFIERGSIKTKRRRRWWRNRKSKCYLCAHWNDLMVDFSPNQLINKVLALVPPVYFPLITVLYFHIFRNNLSNSSPFLPFHQKDKSMCVCCGAGGAAGPGSISLRSLRSCVEDLRGGGVYLRPRSAGDLSRPFPCLILTIILKRNDRKLLCFRPNDAAVRCGQRWWHEGVSWGQIPDWTLPDPSSTPHRGPPSRTARRAFQHLVNINKPPPHSSPHRNCPQKDFFNV